MGWLTSRKRNLKKFTASEQECWRQVPPLRQQVAESYEKLLQIGDRGIQGGFPDRNWEYSRCGYDLANYVERCAQRDTPEVLSENCIDWAKLIIEHEYRVDDFRYKVECHEVDGELANGLCDELLYAAISLAQHSAFVQKELRFRGEDYPRNAEPPPSDQRTDIVHYLSDLQGYGDRPEYEVSWFVPVGEFVFSGQPVAALSWKNHVTFLSSGVSGKLTEIFFSEGAKIIFHNFDDTRSSIHTQILNDNGRAWRRDCFVVGKVKPLDDCIVDQEFDQEDTLAYRFAVLAPDAGILEYDRSTLSLKMTDGRCAIFRKSYHLCGVEPEVASGSVNGGAILGHGSGCIVLSRAA